MEIIIFKDSASASLYAANEITNLISGRPDAVLGLATGGTPVPIYEELARKYQRQELDFSKVTTFNLDEYWGLSPIHPASYHYFMNQHLFSRVNLDPARIHIPNGLAMDASQECLQYERQIAEAGGIDLQILGIGGEGHVGFNEPSSSLSSRTRIKTLISRTREDNKRFFKEDEEVPFHVLTMGVGTIMDAKSILLLAFGKGKAEAIARTVEGPVSARIPASILQMHPKTKILLDEEAASCLELRDYYQYVYENKTKADRISQDK